MKMLSKLFILFISICLIYFITDSITNQSAKEKITANNKTISRNGNEKTIEEQNLQLKMQFLACKAHH
jgi:hypothetical protein